MCKTGSTHSLLTIQNTSKIYLWLDIWLLINANDAVNETERLFPIVAKWNNAKTFLSFSIMDENVISKCHSGGNCHLFMCSYDLCYIISLSKLDKCFNELVHYLLTLYWKLAFSVILKQLYGDRENIILMILFVDENWIPILYFFPQIFTH